MLMVDLGLKSKTLNNAELRSCCAHLLCFCGKNVGLIKPMSLSLKDPRLLRADCLLLLQPWIVATVCVGDLPWLCNELSACYLLFEN
jgi:hypothetical protein